MLVCHPTNTNNITVGTCVQVIDRNLRPLLAHDWDQGSLEVARAFALASAPGGGAGFKALGNIPVLVIHGDLDTIIRVEDAREVVEAMRRERPGGLLL